MIHSRTEKVLLLRLSYRHFTVSLAILTVRLPSSSCLSHLRGQSNTHSTLYLLIACSSRCMRQQNYICLLFLTFFSLIFFLPTPSCAHCHSCSPLSLRLLRLCGGSVSPAAFDYHQGSAGPIAASSHFFGRVSSHVCSCRFSRSLVSET
jgi:hypothetical protein